MYSVMVTPRDDESVAIGVLPSALAAFCAATAFCATMYALIVMLPAPMLSEMSSGRTPKRRPARFVRKASCAS